jgi:hypothetical protein
MSEEQQIAKDKALEIIQSCDMFDQLDVARNYIDLYLAKFNDEKSYNELITIYKEKVSELMNA